MQGKRQDEQGAPFINEFPKKQTILLLLDWLFKHAITCERRSTRTTYSLKKIAVLCGNDRQFKAMTAEADMVFPLFAELPWEATKSAGAFVECLVLLSSAHGLKETWKGMFVQMGFGLINMTGRVVFQVALESLLKKFEQVARFATVHGAKFIIQDTYSLSNGRAPAETANQDVPLFDIRDE